MTREDYVSYEVAKLLKEKGFDEYCRSFYELGEPRVYVGSNGVCNNTIFQEESNECIARPTHQMAMKWMREEHNLSIEISSTESGRWMACAYELGSTMHFVEAYISTCDTYEEAVEAALKYALENLI